jgi:hypothetical protein
MPKGGEVSCEKCWKDAYSRVRADTSKSQARHYEALLKERHQQKDICTPEEQAGDYWDKDKQIDTRYWR